MAFVRNETGRWIKASNLVETDIDLDIQELVEAAREGLAACGGLKFLNDNILNYPSREWRSFFDAAARDGQEALLRLRKALQPFGEVKP